MPRSRRCGRPLRLRPVPAPAFCRGENERTLRYRRATLPGPARAGGAIVAPISSRCLNPTRARGSGFERVGKVLGLAGHLAIQKLHDTHRIGRPAVIREVEFRDPEVARADDAAHREALRVRLRDARGLDIVPAPDALARLRVLEQCVLPVYVVLDIKVICVRGGPVAIERLSNLILTHPPAPPVPDRCGPAAPRHRTLTAHANTIGDSLLNCTPRLRHWI